MNKFNNILSEDEEIELRKLAENEITIGAIKKILLYGVYYNGTMEAGKTPNISQNFATQSALFAIQSNPKVNNEDLGRELRSNVAAIRMLELGFKELEGFKTENKKATDKKNQAR